MSKCDIKELENAILNKFYELAENPEKWDVINRGEMSFGCSYGGLVLAETYGMYRLFYDDLLLKQESCHTWTVTSAYQKLVRRINGSGPIEGDNIQNNSKFATTCRTLQQKVEDNERCKQLEGILKSINEAGRE